MAVSRRKGKRKRPEPLVGAAAFGDDPDRERPTGSSAFGADDKNPQRGAAAFGVDEDGDPRGAEAIGGSTKDAPLRGALLIGNLASGDPTGGDAFGGSSEKAPLRGTNLVGVQPSGDPTGAESFGRPAGMFRFVGADSFGAEQLVPSKLGKDRVGYDFGGVILKADESSMAGIRKSPMDKVRKRIVGILERRLDMDVQKLRTGLDEHAIKWGVFKDPEHTLDAELAKQLRAWYQRAPGGVLGIGHVRDLLEETERMHSFTLHCSWDRNPVTLSVYWDGEIVAYASTKHHKEQTYFEFRDVEGEVLGYADVLIPRSSRQEARVRTVDGFTFATLTLDEPGPRDEVDELKMRLCATIRDHDDKEMFVLQQDISTLKVFKATLKEGDAVVGYVEDRPMEGNIQCEVEVDLGVPQVLAWTIGAIIADLARIRRYGWPAVRVEEEPDIPTVQEALGERRKR